jgi:membrane protease subunit (stomatin/prohibitin family)
MLSRSHNTPVALGQRAAAQRRLRRSAASRHLFCSTNGCTTFMDVDPSGQVATCHICGNRRWLGGKVADAPQGEAH